MPWLPSQEEYEQYRVAGDYSLDRARLPEPKLVLDPAPGDLIIFNAWRVHSVRPVIGWHCSKLYLP